MSAEFIPYLGQNYQELKNSCLKSKKLFEDDQFPPSDASMYKFSKKHKVVWKRASEICKDPKFIIDGSNVSDLDQGALGDCWLISSLAAVASVPEYLEKVVPRDQSFDTGSYAGIFHFRFWRFGYWIDVVVDDYLPVSEGNSSRLLFCQNKNESNEMWGALLEKAYAKVNACYEFIDNGGQPSDALVDLTGGIHESFEIQGKKATIKEAALWTLLIKSTKIKSLMGTSIDLQPSGKHEEVTSSGLITGHAYTIIGAYEIFSNGGAFDKIRESISEPSQSDSIKLLRIRNPWGTESVWNGAYSKNSNDWNNIGDDVKQALKQTGDEADGTFCIPFDLYCKNFDRIHFLHVNLSGLSTENESDDTNYSWTAKTFEGEWINGVNSGGCGNGDYEKYWINPQFSLTLSLENNKDNKCSLIVELMQTDTLKRRLTRARKREEALAFVIYKIKEADGAANKLEHGKKFARNQLLEVGRVNTYLFARQVCKRLNLPAGNYVIIPSTFDKDVDLKFLLRVFIEGALSDSVKMTTLNKQKRVEVVIPTTKPDPKPEEKIMAEEKGEPDEYGQQELQPDQVIGNEDEETKQDDCDLSEEELNELAAEWARLEEEWNKISQLNEENRINEIEKFHGEEEYDDDDDEYEVEEEEEEEDEEDGEDEEEEEEDAYGTTEEEEELEEQLREERRQRKLRKQKKRNMRNKFGNKVIGSIKKTIKLDNDEERNQSMACSVM